MTFERLLKFSRIVIHASLKLADKTEKVQLN